MQFQFSFKHMETSPALQAHAEEKITERIQKFVTKPDMAHVTFEVVRHEHKVHVHLAAGDGFGLEVEASSEDMYASVDLMVDKLASQLKKHKERLKDHKGPKLSQVVEVVSEPQEDAVDAAEIIKYERGRKRAGAR